MRLIVNQRLLSELMIKSLLWLGKSRLLLSSSENKSSTSKLRGINFDFTGCFLAVVYLKLLGLMRGDSKMNSERSASIACLTC